MNQKSVLKTTHFISKTINPFCEYMRLFLKIFKINKQKKSTENNFFTKRIFLNKSREIIFTDKNFIEYELKMYDENLKTRIIYI